MLPGDAPPDPYGTARLRAAVLAGWTASSARFREDANAEEDLARGSYRDRVLVELAQNAADAAARAGEPGHLLLRLHTDELVAANTGSVLDPAGVEGLSTLRASAKRESDPLTTVGRFGVGFAAVRAVADEVLMTSAAGAVRWSLAESRDAVAAVPELAAELARRGDALPVLRLPFAVADPPATEAGYATEVRLPLRDAAARAAVADLLAGLDDALLLSLDALAEVAVEVDGHRRVLGAHRTESVVTVTDGARTTRWRRVAAAGRHDQGLLHDRPVEEQQRPVWSVSVAVPVDAAGRPQPLPPGVPRVLHAPTPTDEPVSLPALVVASVPLEPSRRRAAPGPLLDAVLARAADAYADLVAELPPVLDVLDLVPGPLPAGAVDAVLGTAVLARLRRVAWLPAAAGDERLRPDAAQTVPAARSAADPRALGEHVANLVDPDWWGRPQLRRLGVTTLDLAELLDALAGVRWPPGRWRELYAALDGADPEALAALPVPLADGRLVRGPRGLLVAPELPESARRLGLRVVAAGAAHPLLLRLGAVDASPAQVLADPGVRAAVADAYPDDDPASLDELADAVLSLVALGGTGHPELPWLGGLLLRDDEGELAPAAELVLPGSAAAALLDPDEVAPVADALVERWGAEVLRAVGVAGSLGVVRDTDVPLDGTVDHDLPDERHWYDAVRAVLPHPESAALAELVAVRDLDLVRPDAWAATLRLLGEEPALREAVLGPARVLDARGSRRDVATYTAWWLSGHATIAGRRLPELRTADADPALAALYEPVDLPGVDPALLAATGVRSRLEALTGTPGWAADLLDRLGDPARPVAAEALAELLRLLARADPAELDPPLAVRVPSGGGGTRVVDADDVLVADAPYWAQLAVPGLLPAPAGEAVRLADVLDVALASETVRVGSLSGGAVTPTPDAVRVLLAGAPDTYVEHEELLVAGSPVSWWVVEGTVHACTSDGLARGLAWAAGRWGSRLLVAEVLRDPGRVDELVAERAWDVPAADAVSADAGPTGQSEGDGPGSDGAGG